MAEVGARCDLLQVGDVCVLMVQHIVSSRGAGDMLMILREDLFLVCLVEISCDNKDCFWVQGFLLANGIVQFAECRCGV